jgi:hypothetical protein
VEAAHAILGPEAEIARSPEELAAEWQELQRELEAAATDASANAGPEQTYEELWEEYKRLIRAPAAPPPPPSPEQQAHWRRRLAARGLDATALEAEAYRLRLPEMERLERLIAGAAGRRATLLREFDRRRAARGGGEAPPEVIDAEFEQFEP